MAQELKPFKLGSVELGEYWAYDADDVDAVLAGKDAEIAERKEKYNELAKLHDKAIQACCDADKVIAHHKYKRCLAMAERCNDKIDNPVERDEHDGWLIITEYWERWHKRWLELAEKFKEAK